MEIVCPSEARRLALFHLAQLFFHENTEDLTVVSAAQEGKIEVRLTQKGKEGKGTAGIDLALHRERGRAENAALGKAFALAARGLTDYVPPYGTLFGVRPVKVPLFYRKNGWGKEAIPAFLQEEFSVSPEKSALLAALCETELSFSQSLAPRDAMLYLSIPFCPSRCHYCSFISSSAPQHLALIPHYVSALVEEIRKTGDLFRKAGRRLTAVYMGGGTPGILSAPQLKAVLHAVRAHFDLSSLREFCVEIGRPDTVTEEKLSVLKEAGVTRISINPQTLWDETLLRIGRRHSAADFFRAMDLARPFCFESVNCDLIAGLAGETPADFLASLDRILALGTEEVTLHALCRKRAAQEALLSENVLFWQKAMERAHKTCIKRGLAPYYLYRQKNATADLENTGFAKEGKVGVYNLAMMEDLCDIFSCGAGSIAKLLPRTPGDRIRRFAAFKYPFEYLASPQCIEERLAEMSRFL